MKLSQTRAKIVDEFRNKFEGANTSSKTIQTQVEWLTQALNDYTHNILEVVEWMGEDVVEPDREPPYRVDYVNKSKLLEELQG